MAADDIDRIIITVHGIRTYGRWQPRLEALLRAEFEKQAHPPRVLIKHFQYGFFSTLAFIFPLTRWLMVKSFRRYFLNVVERSSTLHGPRA